MANKVLDTRILLASDTTANLTGSTKVWMKGEVILEFTTTGKIKMKIGDGVNTWDNLKYYGGGGGGAVTVVTHTDTTDPDGAWAASGNTDLDDGTMMIVKDSSGGTVGYIWNDDASTWITFSGNVLAQNVFFNSDITCAGSYTAVGNITKTQSGTTTISSNGKSLWDVMQAIFTKELQPTKTEPSVSLTVTQAGSYEVGTSVTPTWSAALGAGSYTYGPATGVAATTWTITDSDGNSDNTASGSFPAITVGDSTNYTIKAEATYNQGAVANTNMGNPSNPVIQIAAGTKDKTSGAIKGYRSFFYGAVATDSTTPLTSSIIRSLTNGGAYDSAKSITINPITGGKRYIVAIPASSTRSGLTSAILPNSLNAEVKTQYSDITVSVEGANSYSSTPYKIYVYEPASIGGNEIHNITLG